MNIGICSDHAGYAYKDALASLLRSKGHQVTDFGTGSEASVDYPDYAHALAEAIESGKVDGGVALCGTGNGMAITLNKHRGVRAGLAWDSEIARLVKAHNDANVIVLPARFVTYQMATRIVNMWLKTPFEAGRHLRRVEKIPCRED